MRTDIAPALAAYLRGQDRIYDAMNAREQHMTNLFDEGPVATSSARTELRARLARSTDAELVADLRAFFNSHRIHGDRITAAQVSSAIRLLD